MRLTPTFDRPVFGIGIYYNCPIVFRMDEPTYPFTLPRTEVRYQFQSVSSQKRTQKVVLFTETERPEVYNLALLDVLETGVLSDITVTDNKDMRTVRATTMRITANFLGSNPHKIVTFTGTDDRRTRLYRILLSRELALIQQAFVVLGEVNHYIEIFQPNRPYSRFYTLKR
ncbi:MAG: hypothetical protein LH609_08685 [Rudanella sp.]|nr:hypothetical protein [Rudanella sp.]